jgi:hypothetical protein
MISLLLSTFLDISTIFIALMLIAVVAGWAFSLPLALLSLLAVIIFYVQTIGMSQLVVALLSRLLQGRRLRDLGVILAVLVGIAGYSCQFFIGSSGLIPAVIHGTLSQYLQWLPPGMAARAIQQAYVGQWGMSFVWLVALAVISVVVIFLWQLVVSRALTAPEVGGSVGARRRRPKQATSVGAMVPNTPAIAAPSVTKRSLIPPQVLAITAKELKYYRRDPQYARLILLPLAYVLVIAISTVLNAKNSLGAQLTTYNSLGELFVAFRLMIAPAFILLSIFSLAYNTLGFEGQSLTTLFLFPVKPRYVLWGKNLVLFVLGVVELVVVLGVVSFVSHIWMYTLPAVSLGLAGLGIVLASGNITSVLFPQRMRFGRRGFQAAGNMSAQAGILRILLSLLSMVITIIVLLPVLAALLLPVFFHALWFWVISIPFALTYGGVIYFVVTALMAPRMLKRAPEILEVVAKE